MYSNYTDQELLLLLQQDSVKAFDVIYARYSQPLYLYILSKMDAGEASKDVLQDLFTSLWERSHHAFPDCEEIPICEAVAQE